LATIIDPIDSALKGRAHLASLGAEYWIAIVITIIVVIAGILTPRKSVQGAIAVLMFGYQISWATRMFAVMQ
jgi:hypothetical protein